MKRFFRNQSILVLMLFVLISACQKQEVQKQTWDSPPESSFVRENGSVPPGQISTLARANIEEKELKEALEDHMMWCMIRAVLIDANNNNFGALVLKDKYWTDKKGNRRPLTIFRIAFTPDPQGENSCYRSLLTEGHVKHVINLYDGEMYVDDLVAAERAAAEELGASYVRTAELDYGPWRDTIRKHPEQGPEREKATQNVVRLIKEQILMPAGEPPQGNILIHCGGGMHRTGMIIGILQKAINNASMEDIEKTYRYHVGYRDDSQKSGFEQGNLDFINEFKKEYLNKR
jgi:protein-tyrosine phosphatase